MNGAQLLVRALEAQGVRTVFGYPGGAILPFYDALHGSRLRHVLVRHEQGAAIAADGFARGTGEVGVCVATSGPGATNLVTGIANAYLDSVPMLALTGQVPTTVMGTDAFQEVDVLGITMPIVKHSYLASDAADLPRILHEAMRIARSGRPGPVLGDLPKDVLTATPPHPRPFALPPEESQVPDAGDLDAALALLRAAQRPLIYAGGGVRIGKAVAELRAFARASRMPSVMTLQALGAIPGHDPLAMGMLGMHGLKAANLAVQQCDLLLVAGARFDDRVTGVLARFAPKAKVIHLDVDPAEVGKLRRPDVAVIGELRQSLAALTGEAFGGERWRRACRASKRAHAWNYDMPGEGVYAPRMLRDLAAAAPSDTIVACDVGQHQMWVAQHYPFGHPTQHLTSGGLGTMGFGLPAAIGAQFACPDRTVVNVSGDGSFMMNVQELATIRRYGLPIKMVVIDNQCLGMVRQWQELFLDGRYSEVDLSDNPDFTRVAESFGIPAFRLDRAADTPAAIERLLRSPGPLLAHVVIDREANVWPFVPPGKPNDEMMEAPCTP